MPRRVIVPSRVFLALLAMITALGIAIPFVPVLATFWYAALLLVGLLALADLLLLPRADVLRVWREIEPFYNVGRRGTYRVGIENRATRYLSISLRECLPDQVDGADFVLRASLGAGEAREREVEFVGIRRGRYDFPQPTLRVLSLLGLFEVQKRMTPEENSLTLSPGRPARETEWLLTRAAILEEAGQRRTRKRGIDREFESLREYVVGDEIRRMDWKASAKRFKPHVRQYQSERSTELIFALDCGRLMGSLIEGVSKLDLVMTPLLDLAAVALRRDERIGFLGFDSKPLAFMPPRQGMQQLNNLVQTLSTLPEAREPTSYLRAVRYLETRHRKRCLIVFLTDFTDELSAREMHATLAAMARRHVMIFVAVGDPHLRTVVDTPRLDTTSLFERAVAGQLLQERRQTIAQLDRMGALTIDADPMQISGPLISRYLDVRLRGML